MILTFYSYKGGVGRSMALANVGDALAREGLRVLMIDFDLEAPGLEQFFPINHAHLRSHAGLLDLLLSYKQAMSQAGSGTTEQASFRQLKELFIVPVYDQLPSGGRLDLLPAGQRGDEEQLANYALNLRTFDWQDFYFNWAGELFFDWLRQSLRSLYDLVLVDSRTGVTEMGGICAYQLADTIAMFCASNQQNLQGTLNVLENFFSPRVRILRRNRPLQLLVIPSRVEQRDNPLLEDFYERFEQAFAAYTPPGLKEAGLSFWDLIIPYQPHYAFKEQVVASRAVAGNEPQVSAAYDQLVQAIELLAEPDTPLGQLYKKNGHGKSAVEAQYDVTRRRAGYDLFLYYHPEDGRAVESLVTQLAAEPYNLTVFDPGPLLKGTAWQATVDHALEDSRACLLLLGPSAQAPWENEELRSLVEKRLSGARPLRLLPALLPGAKAPDPERVPVFVAGQTWRDLRGGMTAEAVKDLALAVQGIQAEGGKHRMSPVEQSNPYKGLNAFEEADAEVFFGRDALLQESLDLLQGRSFLFIIGPSGIGKSSFVNAGLVPALRAGALPGSRGWRFLHMRPGQSPLESLARVFARFVEGASADEQQVAALRQGLEQNPKELLLVADAMGCRQKGIRLVLVVDQLEEIWTLSPAHEERETFLEHLSMAATAVDTTYLVFFILRADYYSEIVAEPILRELVVADQLLVGPMSRPELEQAILKPAQRVGLAFEPGLLELILDEVADEPGALPLLQFVLQLLWERQSQGFLTHAAYQSFGGLHKALSWQADNCLSRLSEHEQELARSIFSGLIQIGRRGTQDTRRTAVFEELVPASAGPEDVQTVVQKLVDARLVTTRDEGGRHTITLAHEKLIDVWPWLKRLVDENREVIALQNEITNDAKEWEEHGRDPSYLYLGARLANAREKLGAGELALSSVAKDFVESSIQSFELERQRRKRLQRQVIGGFAGVAVVIVVMLATAVLVFRNQATQNIRIANTSQAASTLAVQQQSTAVAYSVEVARQSNIALARQLAAQSQSAYTVAGKGHLISALLAIESMRILPSVEAFQALQKGMVGLPRLTSLQQLDSPVRDVAFSPDGKYIVSSTPEGIVLVWEAATGREISRMTHEGPVLDADFSPDARFVVSGGQDGVVRVWEVATGREVVRMLHEGPVLDVDFSPDGRLVASGSEDGTARVWEAETGAELGQISYGSPVLDVAFSADGNYVVSNSQDGQVIIGDLANEKEIPFLSLGISIVGMALSPDARSVAVGSEDGAVHLYDLLTGDALWHGQHEGTVVAVAFSPDGGFVASGSLDSTVRVWNAATGREMTQMKHDGPVTSLAIGPDGNYILSGSEDGTARVWEVATGLEILRMTHDDVVRAVAFSPDGRYVASGGDDGTTRVWELSRSQEAVALMQMDGAVQSVAFRADGAWLVSGGADRTARVWEALTGKEIARMTHPAAVSAVAFSRFLFGGAGRGDRDYVVSSSSDGLSVIWEAETGTEAARMIYGGPLLALSPDMLYALTLNEDGTASLWDASRGREIQQLPGDVQVFAAAFSRDGSQLVTAGLDDIARLWHPDTGNWGAETRQIGEARVSGPVFAVAFSPDGKYIASGSQDGTMYVWEALTGKGVASMSHEGAVFDVDFDPGGQYILSGSQDGTARVWEIVSGTEIARMTHENQVRAVAFSPDQKYAVSGSDEGELRLWYWRPEDLIAEVCARLPRNLTLAEWTQYFGYEPYRSTCPNLPGSVTP